MRIVQDTAFYSVDLNLPFTFWIVGYGGAQRLRLGTVRV
jgi:hypothetical protein